MSKHTPGPWNVIEGVADGGGIAIGPDLEDVGPHALVTFNGGESEANARLIAAAPEMLDALRLCLAGMEGELPEGCQNLHGDIRVLLAKIEGGAR